MVPSDPPAQTVPEASTREYPYCSMAGMAMTPITTSTAPTMPVEAAMTAAITIVASASPPGSRPNHILNA